MIIKRRKKKIERRERKEGEEEYNKRRERVWRVNEGALFMGCVMLWSGSFVDNFS